MEREFNTAGPMKAELHYTIPPLERWNTNEILDLIDRQKYFVLHAPRQTGKTSCLLALRDFLNTQGKYNCVYTNFEAAQAARNNIDNGIRCAIRELDNQISILDFPFNTPEIKEFVTMEGENALNLYLSAIAKASYLPMVILIDEIDALVGDVLVSVLRQIRSGYANRPENFPHSIILCGVRDIRDYRIHRSDGEVITGGSAFNIKSESLSLGNFSEREVCALYTQHTEETGQIFEEEVFPKIMAYTAGQPWLVNALAYEAAFKMRENRDRSIPLTVNIMETAKERLILSRSTHLDQLADKLKEERVRCVIEPLLASKNATISNDDAEYCLDLGLIKKDGTGFVISNEIYKEVLPRELTTPLQNSFLSVFSPDWVNSDGSLNGGKLLEMFSIFWRENGEIWTNDIPGYKEAAPHLVFQGFLQRVANGNGIIEREYALGSGRVDIMLKWRSAVDEQRIVIELKTLKERDAYETLLSQALDQTTDYADKCAATEAHILIFDRVDKMPVWRSGDIFTETREHRGRKITVWGL